MERDFQFQYSNTRPETQAQYFMNPVNKYGQSTKYTLYNYEKANKRPLTINHTKMTYTHSPYYGNLREPIKATNKVMTDMQYVPNYKLPGQKFIIGGGLGSEGFLGSSIARERNFPSELKMNFMEQGKQDPGWNKFKRNVITSDSGRPFKEYPRSLLPISETANDLNEDSKQYECSKGATGTNDKVESGKRTVGNTGRTKLRSQQCPRTAQGPGGRPESRYKKESLYTKLDHGRAASPDYKVPILEMNFSELKNQPKIPDWWKEGH